MWRMQRVRMIAPRWHPGRTSRRAGQRGRYLAAGGAVGGLLLLALPVVLLRYRSGRWATSSWRARTAQVPAGAQRSS